VIFAYGDICCAILAFGDICLRDICFAILAFGDSYFAIFTFGDSGFVSLCLCVHYNVLKKSFVTFCGLHIYLVLEPKQSKKIPRNHKLRGILYDI
jgi:hypothetical protein